MHKIMLFVLATVLVACAAVELEPMPADFLVGDLPDDAGGAFRIKFIRSSLEVIYLSVLAGADPQELMKTYSEPLETAYLEVLAGEDPAVLMEKYQSEPLIVAGLSSQTVKAYHEAFVSAVSSEERPPAFPFVSGYRISRVDWFAEALNAEVIRAELAIRGAENSLEAIIAIDAASKADALIGGKEQAEEALTILEERRGKLEGFLEMFEKGETEANTEQLAYLFADEMYLATHSRPVGVLSPIDVSQNGVYAAMSNEMGGEVAISDPAKWKKELTEVTTGVRVGKGGYHMTSYFRLQMMGPDGVPLVDEEGKPLGFAVGGVDSGEKAVAFGNWFNWERFNVLVALLIFSMFVLYFIFTARKGKELFLRRIAGLDHVEEAIGRATEMGKPILYVSGLSDASDISTIAAMTILGRVARKAAEYDTPLIVPCYDPIVMMVEQEIVKEAYAEAGRPDAYNEDSIYFVTTSQFGYVAAVDGVMVREKPATNFYMGYFYAESLILAETGAATGAIQIAGTDATTQLPFFITSCDYCLMGEELYAAGAYLSREPKLLGSIKGQDWSKFVVALLIVIGVLLAAGGVTVFADLFTAQ